MKPLDKIGNNRQVGRMVAFGLCAAALAVVLSLACSNPFEKKPRSPVISLVPDTTVSVRDTIKLIAHVRSSGGPAVSIAWRLDGHDVGDSAFADSGCCLFFGVQDTGRHVVVAKALGESSTMSAPETTIVTVRLNPPVAHFITPDTSVYPNDTVKLLASGSDPNGSVVGYAWSVGDSAGPGLNTRSGTLTYVFPPLGKTYVVRVRAMDNDSILSAPDSIFIVVRASFPFIAAERDTIIAAINDTVYVRAVRLDSTGIPVRWIWAGNGVSFYDTTQSPSFPVRFGRTQAGLRTVFVKAVDSHQLSSNVDSARVQVHLYVPTVSIVHDTSVYINDPIFLRAHAFDTNGTVQKYAWALDGLHFADSSVGDSMVHVWSRADTGRRVLCASRHSTTTRSNRTPIRAALLCGSSRLRCSPSPPTPRCL